MRAVAFSAILITACGRIGFSELDDQGDAMPSCTLGPWSAPAVLPEFAGGAPEYDPSFAADRTELWFVRDNADFDIVSARRDVSGTYSGETNAPFNQVGEDALEPALTADGLIILYSANGQVFEARRASTADLFGPGSPAAGLELVTVNDFDISADGLTLYFDGPSNTMYQVTRPTRASPFGTQLSLGFNGRWPSISADQRELYFQRGAGQGATMGFVRTRASVPGNFDDEAPMTPVPAILNGDFEITADGKELWFTTFDDSLYRMTRACL